MWAPGVALSTVLLSAYLFEVMYATWRGRISLPDPELDDIWELVAACAKGGLATALALLPYYLYVWLRYHPTPYADGPFGHSSYIYTSFELNKHLTDPVGLLFLASGLVWAPVGLMLASVRTPLSHVVHPGLGWRMIREMGADFYAGVGVFWILFALWTALGSLSDYLAEASGWYVVMGALFALPRFYVALMAARALGVLLYVHGAELGYGGEDLYLIPVLGDVLPREEAPVVVEAPLPVAAPEAISLPEMDPVPACAPGFVAWQPQGDSEALLLDEGSLVAPTVVPQEAPRPTVTEDLTTEDEFLESLGLKPS
jgi:hypothetical protein